MNEFWKGRRRYAVGLFLFLVFIASAYFFFQKSQRDLQATRSAATAYTTPGGLQAAGSHPLTGTTTAAGSPSPGAPGGGSLTTTQTYAMTDEEARTKFLQRYPGKQWRFRSIPEVGWERLEGDTLEQYKGRGARQATLDLFHDHPELMAGIPEGASLQIAENVQETPGGTAVPIEVLDQRGLPYPGNGVVFFDKDGKPEEVRRSVPRFSEKHSCDQISQAQATGILTSVLRSPRDTNVRIEVANGPKAVRKIIYATGGAVAEDAWAIHLKRSAPSGEESVYLGVVSACSGTILQSPQPTEQE